MCCNTDRYRSQQNEYLFNDMSYDEAGVRRRQESYSTATVAVRSFSAQTDINGINRDGKTKKQSEYIDQQGSNYLQSSQNNQPQKSEYSNYTIHKSGQKFEWDNQTAMPNQFELPGYQEHVKYSSFRNNSIKMNNNNNSTGNHQNNSGSLVGSNNFFNQTTKSSLNQLTQNQLHYGSTFDVIPETPENYKLEQALSNGSQLDLDAI
ncbi:UNKNOWN [Stylonychia lemnae]|uniref:Uncharacterized protein n=1 Tax=Stylonychia lemnae TaxID=5949 RepID=A0A078AD78_STYLE|nr:UNKNOWN [Stylonychia lemnae]|eukprot:CDW79796.1 UNKNOWN [Stylonychia lemnae]